MMMTKATTRVMSGLDSLLDTRRDLLRGLRVGLISNPTGVTADVTSNVDALREAGVNLVALYGPEHGFASHVQDGLEVGHGVDERTGLPVYSLYGEARKPTPEMLGGIDALVFDIQDAGVRFYTYLWTMALCMQAAAENGLRFVVLDRPNPITGMRAEGPVLEPGYESYVGLYPVALRLGLTVGELARLVNDHFGVGADLTVIPLEGWRREMWYDETGLPWVAPSPNLPSLDTAIVYPGTCLVEGTNLSEGRGTTRPFEMIGSPWLDGFALAEALNDLGLAGVRFRPTAFIPTFSKHANETCYGVQLHVTDRDAFMPVPAALHLIAAARSQSPARFAWASYFPEGTRPFDLLIGNGTVRAQLDEGTPVNHIVAAWAAGLAQWTALIAPHQLYA